MTAGMQEAVVFENRNGLKLFGILHAPATAQRRGPVFILLSPGVKMRVGPQCLYRRMTDRLTASGFTVFRFDFFGLGDAEGELTETLLADVYNHIEVGRFVDDTLDAMDWLQRQHGYDRFVLSGLCGGAITGLLAGQRDPRVAGLLALGITPVLASSAADTSAYMTAGQLRSLRAGYFRKLLNAKSILRLLTLQSDFRLIGRVLTEPYTRWKRGRSPTPVATFSDPAPATRDNANPLFPPAFFHMIETGRPMLLVFSGADRLYWEFEEKFVARHQARLRQVSAGYDVHVIPNANHVMSFRHWENEMLDVSEQWLNRRFPLAAG